MKKILIIVIILLYSSLAQGQFWENPNQKPSLFGMRINRANPLSEGIVGGWLMSENKASRVYDLSGNGNNGTEQMDSIWQPGEYGPTRYFSGNDYIVVPNSPSLQVASEITIIVRHISSDITYRGVIQKGTLDVGTGDWNLNYLSGEMVSNIVIGGIQRAIFGNNDTLANIWYTTAFTCKSGEQVLYMDGKVITSNTYTGAIQTSSEDLYIGAYYSTSYLLTGKIDYVIIYNHALSASEIALHYREPFSFMEPNWDMELYGWMTAAAPGAGQFIFINQ